MSGSVEENSVEAQGVTSPLRRIARLSAPSREAYATTPAEINALGLLNQQGGPQMIGFLAGLQSDRTNAQDAYEQQLQQVNADQSRLARLADAREARQQDVSLARSFMNTPNAGSLLQIMQPLFTPEGVRTAGQFTTTELAERTSKAALQNAQAQRALRTGSGDDADEGDLLNNANRAQRFVTNAVRNDPDVQRLDQAARTARALLMRIDPAMAGAIPSVRAQQEAAQAAVDTAQRELDAARIRARDRAMASLPGQRAATPNAAQPQAGAPAEAPAATTQQPAARVDENAPTALRPVPPEMLAEAQRQIRELRKPPAAIAQRLRELGYDPSGLR